MNKKKTLLLSAILFGIGVIFTIISYFMFHYLGDDALLHSIRYEEAQKPLVTNMAAIFATLCIFGSLVSLLIALIKYSENKKLN